MPTTLLSTRSLRILVCALPVLLAACGGGSSGPDPRTVQAPLSCGTADLQDWLRAYFKGSATQVPQYFWYGLSPDRSPATFATVESYFDALIYGGGDLIPGDLSGARWPLDRYSGFESTTSFNRFFGDGQTLGYGVAVAGLEVEGQPTQPLNIRYLEPLSPAAAPAAGLQRGDRVISLNGRLASDIIAADDFSVLSPNAVGDRLTLLVRGSSGFDRTVVLTAAIYGLSPVQNDKLVISPRGRLMGYVMVKDMINQASTRLASAFSSFRSAGAQELVLDLRYNGGGLVSVGNTVASYAAGARGDGQVFARLLYNDQVSVRNQDSIFTNPAAWTGFSKVYVLVGPRTCSASEQVINGLRGVGVNVVAIGHTTCGKPVGFLPQSDSCGMTYSVVNFESVNARNEGRYFDGFQATCAVAEDLGLPIGDPGDPLLVAAAHHADQLACPPGTAVREQPQSRSLKPRSRYSGADGGERSGMSAQ